MLKRIKQAEKHFDSKSSGELAEDLIEMALKALFYCQTLYEPIMGSVIILSSGMLLVFYNLLIMLKGHEGKMNLSVVAFLSSTSLLAYYFLYANSSVLDVFFVIYLICILAEIVNLFFMKSTQKILYNDILE